MNEYYRRIRYLLNRRRLDRELAGDMEFHREMAVREGRAPLGNTLLLREQARDAWGWTWLDRLSQDLRYAARMLRKSPGFTLAAVLVLATGIGMNVTAFGLFDMMVLKPLPVREPDTILQFHRSSSKEGSATLVAYPAVAFYGEHAATLSAVMAASGGGLTFENEASPVSARFVTANFFSELGAGAKLGRVLNPVLDGGVGGDPAVVLDYRFWQRRFASDPSIVGRTIRLNRMPATVVGVAAEKFTGLDSGRSDIWAPMARQPYFVAGSPLLTGLGFGDGVAMFGRLRHGVTPKAAEEELRALTAALRRQHPGDFWEDERLASERGGYASQLHPDVYAAFALAATLMLLILAVACANLGGLLLARGVAREHEIAIRAALGAGRARIVRQLFTESLLLSLIGTGVGVALSYSGVRIWMAATETPPWIDPAPDWRVAIFALVTGVMAAVFYGLTPAMQAARRPHRNPSSTSRHRESRSRQILIGAQVAASCVLLIVAGLLVRALQHALSTYPGFDYEHVVAIDPGLGSHGFKPAAARAYLDHFTSRLRQVPGVESLALSSLPPLGNYNLSIARIPLGGRRVDAYLNRVDPEFFHTMNIPLLRGRNLRAGDTGAVIVSESLARREWPGGDGLGKPFSIGPDASGQSVNYTVLGIAGNARIAALNDSDAVEIYYVALDQDLPSVSVVARLRGDPDGFIGSARAIAGGIDPTVLPAVRPLTAAFHDQLRPVERGALMASVMGAVASLLAVLGILGLVAYAVSQRRREIGIRMALGAKSSDVLRTILLSQFLRPVALGVLIGTAGAAILSRLLRHVLYGIGNLDPASYSAAILLLIVMSTAGALVPARRALKVDPMRALRHE